MDIQNFYVVRVLRYDLQNQKLPIFCDMMEILEFKQTCCVTLVVSIFNTYTKEENYDIL